MPNHDQGSGQSYRSLTEDEIDTLPIGEVVERTLRQQLDPGDLDSYERYDSEGYRAQLADDLRQYRVAHGLPTRDEGTPSAGMSL